MEELLLPAPITDEGELTGSGTAVAAAAAAAAAAALPFISDEEPPPPLSAALAATLSRSWLWRRLSGFPPPPGICIEFCNEKGKRTHSIYFSPLPLNFAGVHLHADLSAVTLPKESPFILPLLHSPSLSPLNLFFHLSEFPLPPIPPSFRSGTLLFCPLHPQNLN